MKHEPRQAIHVEKLLRWAHKLGRAESLRFCKAGQTVLAKLMESQIWHPPISSVGGGLSKGTMTSVHPNARHFSSSLCTTGVIQAAIPVLDLKGSESE